MLNTLGFFSSDKDSLFRSTIAGIIGSKPKNIEVYKLALSHSSVALDSNERLEFLGDAVLGSIIAEYLFKKFPYKDEGFLTEIRSRIVKRESMNTLAIKIGLDKLVQSSNVFDGPKAKSIYGNALEAFIGAVYLDKGYSFCSNFVINQIVQVHVNLHDTVERNYNFKSQLIEWAQKEGKKVVFEMLDEEFSKHERLYSIQVYVDTTPMGIGKAVNKKKAEQAAAEKTCQMLSIS